MMRDPKLRQDSKDFMSELVAKGYAHKVPETIRCGIYPTVVSQAKQDRSCFRLLSTFQRNITQQYAVQSPRPDQLTPQRFNKVS